MKSDYYLYTDQGRRPENEDSVSVDSIRPNRIVAILADGLGGHGGGAIASQTAVQCLHNLSIGKDFPDQVQIAAWIETANQQIIAKQDGPNRMKTTIVYLCIQDNQAIWAHIGDSRLYHFYKGNFSNYTKDHSMTQIAVIQGDITRNQMCTHPDRSRLVRAMGNSDVMPEIHNTVQLQPGLHAFLLCSDGFWEFLQEEEILMDLHKSSSPEIWINYLRHRCEKRKRNAKEIDNNTAAAVFVVV